MTAQHSRAGDSLVVIVQQKCKTIRRRRLCDAATLGCRELVLLGCEPPLDIRNKASLAISKSCSAQFAFHHDLFWTNGIRPCSSSATMALRKQQLGRPADATLARGSRFRVGRAPFTVATTCFLRLTSALL